RRAWLPRNSCAGASSNCWTGQMNSSAELRPTSWRTTRNSIGVWHDPLLDPGRGTGTAPPGAGPVRGSGWCSGPWGVGLGNRMSSFLQRAKSYQAAIREVLMREWDPIGVADAPQAQDEYDQYINQIYGMLIRREPRNKLVDFLWWAETENMGLYGNG